MCVGYAGASVLHKCNPPHARTAQVNELLLLLLLWPREREIPRDRVCVHCAIAFMVVDPMYVLVCLCVCVRMCTQFVVCGNDEFMTTLWCMWHQHHTRSRMNDSWVKYIR